MQITILVLGFLVFGVIGLTTSDNPTITKAQESNCQYPTRPLNPDGSCDNSDPCDPTTIKEPGLYGKCRDDSHEIKKEKYDSKPLQTKPTTILMGK